jgi:hypothetical protein
MTCPHKTIPGEPFVGTHIASASKYCPQHTPIINQAHLIGP